jgi:hypothetical protein
MGKMIESKVRTLRLRREQKWLRQTVRRDVRGPVLILKARLARLEKIRKSEFWILRSITLVILRDCVSSLGSSEWASFWKLVRLK